MVISKSPPPLLRTNSGIVASSEVNRTLERRLSLARAAKLRPYIAMNFVITCVLCSDVYLNDCSLAKQLFFNSLSTLWQSAEHIILYLSIVNLFITFCYVVWPHISSGPILLTKKQKLLLSVKEKEFGFGNVCEPVAKSTPKSTIFPSFGDDLDWLFRLRGAFRRSPSNNPNNTSLMSLSGSTVPQSPTRTPVRFGTSFGSEGSYTPSALPNSYLNSPGSSFSIQSYPTPSSLENSMVESPTRFSQTLLRLRRANASAPFAQNVSIHSEEQLQQYLAKCDDHLFPESHLRSAMKTPNLSFGGTGQTSYEIGHFPIENEPTHHGMLSASLQGVPTKESAYNLPVIASPKPLSISSLLLQKEEKSKDIGSQSTSTRTDLSTSTSTKISTVVWLRFEIDPDVLDVYVQNLRSYISNTILKRVVREIDSLNTRFASRSRPDLRVGEAPLASLQHVLTTLGDQFSNLRQVIPYLELTSNQQYLVRRIKDLAKDGCMMEYRWNSGGSEPLAGGSTRPWEEHLPSDAELVWHLWCTYMDSQLPPNPVCEQGKSFSSLYSLRAPGKPSQAQKSDKNTFIYQSVTDPPHFNLVICGGDETISVDKGRNNLWHCILLFLKRISLDYDNHLGPINLGPSGLNVMWIFEN